MQRLDGLDPQRFLADYWQRRPLLIRRAWPAFADPLEPEELAGLACEDGVTARLVLEHGRRPWELRTGPFAEAEFTRLPATHWTLLVSDVEKHLPDLTGILEPFRFVPDWRIDDLQISYATPQGSVGPHWDDYDVFLLQGRGRRRWQLDERPVAADNFRTDTTLRILRDFRPMQDWVLESGDLLYLPPRVAHHGVALEPCLTYSIGFRAPGRQELLAGFVDHLLEQPDAGIRYTDPGLRPQDNPGLIRAEAFAQVERLLRDALIWEPAELRHWFGGYVTEPKPGFEPEPPESPLGAAALARLFAEQRTLQRHAGARFACCAAENGDLDLFCNGRHFELAADAAWLGERLCRQYHYSADELHPALAHDATARVLLTLFNRGDLVVRDED